MQMGVAKSKASFLLPLFIICLIPLTSALSSTSEDSSSVVVEMVVEVTNNTSHDPTAFTQGLLWHQGMFYESTGLVGYSTIREVFPNGTVNRSQPLDPLLFGEGLALVGEHLIQLTYQNNIALRWNLSDFQLLGQMNYSGEGWGLCYDGTDLVMSNGTDVLTFRDPADFTINRTVNVSLNGIPLNNLNELECDGAYVWANIWHNDTIVRIPAANGTVDMVVNASGLYAYDNMTADTDVLNGIAIDGEGDFWLTGKNWPTMFEVDFVEIPENESDVQQNISTPEKDDSKSGSGDVKGAEACEGAEQGEDCDEDAPLTAYLVHGSLALLAVTTAVVGMFKVWSVVPKDEEKGFDLEDVFDDEE